MRPCGHKLFLGSIYSEIHAFERSSAKKEQVSLFGEDDFVDGEMLLVANDGEAHAACDLLSIGHLEGQVFFLALDAEFFQGCCRNPGAFASRIDQHVGESCGARTLHRVLDFAADGKGAHKNSPESENFGYLC